MNEVQVNEFKHMLKEELIKARSEGLAIGARVILDSILEIANNEKLSNPKRIAEIKEFCEIGLGMRNKEVTTDEI